MPSTIKRNIAMLAALASMSACANFAFKPISAEPPESEQSAADALASTPAEKCNRLGPQASIDSYKIGAAHHILRSNLGLTFDGQLPPMLPAIVVLRLSVDGAGKLTDVDVQRSRDDVASEVAMASIRRSGTFPPPCGLIARPADSLIFSETFLFNDQYQFQLRSVAGPQ